MQIAERAPLGRSAVAAPPARVTLMSLPVDLLVNIVLLLNQQDRARLACACRATRDACRAEAAIAAVDLRDATAFAAARALECLADFAPDAVRAGLRELRLPRVYRLQQREYAILATRFGSLRALECTLALDFAGGGWAFDPPFPFTSPRTRVSLVLRRRDASCWTCFSVGPPAMIAAMSFEGYVWDREMRNLSGFLRNNSTLGELSLSGACVTSAGVRTLAEELRPGGGAALRVLRLNNARVGNAGVEALMGTIVEEIHLRGNEFDDYGVAFAPLRAPGARVRTLDVAYNNITDAGALYLAAVLDPRPPGDAADDAGARRGLSALDLSNNDITARGAEHLAIALSYNKTLARLSLNHNNIAEGATAFARCLMRNATLRHLGLQFCGVGDGSALPLVDLLRANAALQCVDLRGNQFGRIAERLLREVGGDRVLL